MLGSRICVAIPRALSYLATDVVSGGPTARDMSMLPVKERLGCEERLRRRGQLCHDVAARHRLGEATRAECAPRQLDK